jgi:NHL repeat
MPKICRGLLAILRRGRCLVRHDLGAGMDLRRPVFRSGHGEPAGALSLVWARPQLLRLGRIVIPFAALVVSLTLTAAASADVSFTRAWGWGVSDGASQFETCTSTCQEGLHGSGAGQLSNPYGVATGSSGDVYVADEVNNRIDEFSAAGKFIDAWGWGVVDGASKFETCTSTCRAGIGGDGAGGSPAPPGSPPVARVTSTSPSSTTSGSTSSPPPARSSEPGAGALSTAPANLRPAPAPARPGSRAPAPGSSTTP